MYRRYQRCTGAETSNGELRRLPLSECDVCMCARAYRCVNVCVATCVPVDV